MKILNASQIRDLDAYTMTHEPISSIDLMERAATRWTEKFLTINPHLNGVSIFCGPGNNGGDGAAIARLLSERTIPVRLYLCHIGSLSEDLEVNMNRLMNLANPNLEISDLRKGEAFPAVPEKDIIIDGLFGSGLNRPVTGDWGNLIHQINDAQNLVYSIDIPSGLHPDVYMDGAIIEADYTITFELPKFSFMCPENASFVGQLEIVSIGLDSEHLREMVTPNQLIDEEDIHKIHQHRSKFDHKGIFGHGLIIAGSEGKMGAALLAGKGALRSGIGLLTLHVPKRGLSIVQTALPEAMASIDQHDYCFSGISEIDNYSAIGLGCGLTTSSLCADGLTSLFKSAVQPMVIDADALNIIATRPDLLEHIPEWSILTPHFKEFERIFGSSDSHYQRIEKARSNAVEHQVCILLKGAYSALATPEGKIFINSTGNPGMATAGSGDVLTGILTGILAQHYDPVSAAKIGMYIHGKAGDIASDELGHESLIASDIIDHLGLAFRSLDDKNI